MLVIGITGGIGCGKSTVANLLREKEHIVYDMDSAAREIMLNNDTVKSQLIKEFGNEVYLEDNSLNTSFLAEKIFKKNDTPLLKLNSIVHPLLIEDMMNYVESQEDTESSDILFIDSPLIYELNIEAGFDYILAIDAPENIRFGRIKARSGLNKEQIANRIKAQIEHSEKVKKADFVINNEGSLKELKTGLDFILDILLTLPEKEKYEGSEE